MDENNQQNNKNNEELVVNKDDNLDTEDTQVDDLSILRENQRDEEFAAEISPVNGQAVQTPDDDVDTNIGTPVNSVMGWAGLALSILSFFMLPIILGGAGIIVGVIARRREAEWLGNTAIAAGVVSIIVRLFIVPFF